MAAAVGLGAPIVVMKLPAGSAPMRAAATGLEVPQRVDVGVGLVKR